MSKAKKFSVFLTVIALILTLPAAALESGASAPLSLVSAQPPETSAHAMALLDCQSGTLLAAKNENERLPMASTTKIMTALVVLERLPLSQTIRVPQEAVGVEGSSIYLYRDECITVETLLYALLLSSANDAAAALAIACSGSIEAFATAMNEKADTLGLCNTHFCNPHGLHNEQHYTTAADLARLCAAALQNKDFAKIVRTQRYLAAQQDTGATRLFVNHNRLLRTYEGAIGVKTGFTKAAGRCLVSAAEREGLRLVAVTLAAPNDWQDHAALLDFGFSHYEAFTPLIPPLSLPVVGGSIAQVALVPKFVPTNTLARDHGEITCTLEAPRFLYGSFPAGKVCARLIYRANGAKIAEIPLMTAHASQVPRRPGFWARMQSIFQK